MSWHPVHSPVPPEWKAEAGFPTVAAAKRKIQKLRELPLRQDINATLCLHWSKYLLRGCIGKAGRII
jgi:hypothetical protein